MGQPLHECARRPGSDFAAVAAALATRVDAFRTLQSEQGSVILPTDAAVASLRMIAGDFSDLAIRAGHPEVGAAVRADVDRWIARGLDRTPAFDSARAVLAPPGNGQDVVVLAPILATNGPAPRGHFLEFFWAFRDEPAIRSEAAAAFPHPKNKCQSLRLRIASAGFATGNCIVFFPENVAGRDPVEAQNYAMFFFNKFQAIYEHHTLPVVERLFGRGDGLFGHARRASSAMEPSDCYAARCLWGHLHDYFHHQGPRPFDENLQLKLNWFRGLLEEIKCDARTALAVHRHRLPHHEAIFEFVLFERMFRYPCQPDCVRNFDAGTGVFLFEWLAERGALETAESGLTLNLERVLDALNELVARIEAIESLEEIPYRVGARAFVREYLPEGTEGDRFQVPPRYRALVGAGADQALIRFTPADLY